MHTAISYVSSRWEGWKTGLRQWKAEKLEKREKAKQTTLEKKRQGTGGSTWRDHLWTQKNRTADEKREEKDRVGISKTEKGEEDTQ